MNIVNFVGKLTTFNSDDTTTSIDVQTFESARPYFYAVTLTKNFGDYATRSKSYATRDDLLAAVVSLSMNETARIEFFKTGF